MTQKERIEIAKGSMQIMDAGFYHNRHGEKVDISDALTYATTNSVLYKPEDFDMQLSMHQQHRATAHKHQTKFEVSGETTLQAMARLSAENEKMLCLNFASAKNPGGGFLTGAHAQEESLARSSGLYACLAQRSQMYTVNRKYNSCLYTDHMIYSPAVPFFKNDDGELLDKPYLCSVLTVPAVNAGVVLHEERDRADQIEPVMLSRMEKFLTIASLHRYQTLVLGAWGCGVFRNSPEVVAGHFHYHLTQNPALAGAFKHIVFAVWDNTSQQVVIKPFAERFK